MEREAYSCGHLATEGRMMTVTAMATPIAFTRFQLALRRLTDLGLGILKNALRLSSLHMGVATTFLINALQV